MSGSISGIGFQPKEPPLEFLSFQKTDIELPPEGITASDMEIVSMDEEGFNLLACNTIIRFNYSDSHHVEDG